MNMKKESKSMKVKLDTIIKNREASHNYFILDTLECGLALRGNEVKSIRHGLCSLRGAWIDISDNQLILKDVHITKWDTANIFDVDEKRSRVLLAHKSEIRKLLQQVKEKGITLIPLEMYQVNGRYKVKVGVCQGKKNYDKRQSLKEQQIKRDIARQMKVS